VTRSGETPRQQVRKAKQTGRRRFSAEDKIRIVMEGIRGEDSVSELCRRERLHNTVYYRWLKDFMAAGKRRLRGDVQREAGREEVLSLRDENACRDASALGSQERPDRCVKVLIAKGADTNVWAREGRTPQQVAAASGNRALAAVLSRYGERKQSSMGSWRV